MKQEGFYISVKQTLGILVLLLIGISISYIMSLPSPDYEKNIFNYLSGIYFLLLAGFVGYLIRSYQYFKDSK